MAKLINPEFRKNLWLELSPNRLVLMPLVLGAIFFLTYLSGDSVPEFMRALKSVSLILFCLLVFIWGGKLAAESVISEVNDGTWDFQRMTSLEPWDMAIGKLFGSPVYPWYGGGFCAGAYLIATLYLPDPLLNLKFLLVMVMVGVFCHALSLSVSLMGIRKLGTRQKINSSFYFVAGMAFLIFIGPWFFSIFRWYGGEDEMIRWYFFRGPCSDFMIFTALFFLVWSVIGVYRNMRTELQRVNGPWVWVIFLISLMGYLSGLFSNADDLSAGDRFLLSLYLSYAVGITFTYCTAFGEPKDIVEFRLILDKLKKQEWEEFGNRLPLWGLSLALSVLFGCVLFLLSFGGHGMDVPGEEVSLPLFYFFNVLCFLLRDLLLLIYVNLKGPNSRADLAVLIYLMILYLLIPLMIVMAGAEALMPVFVPTFDSHVGNGTLPIFAQCLLMGYLVSERWKIRGRLLERQGEGTTP